MIDFGIDRSAQVLSRAFEDYVVRIPFNAAMLLNLIRADSVDLSVSRIVVRDGDAVAAALIARRGWTCRLAAMGIVPEARRTGLGRSLVLQLIDEARTRGDRTMILEVMEQNTAAVQLYRACEFETIRRLVGFAGPPPPNDDVPADLTEVDLREVADVVTRYGLRDLPWQLSGESIAQLAPPAVGYRLNGAWIALTDPAQPVVAVRALIAEPTAQNPGREADLLRAVIAKYPGKTEWRFNPVWPEELADILAPIGLPRTALTQFQMQRAI
jgi:GNAT superfamily N-acetyltransferase